MRTPAALTLPPAIVLLAGLLAAACGGSTVESLCVRDADCPDRNYCTDAGRCAPAVDGDAAGDGDTSVDGDADGDTAADGDTVADGDSPAPDGDQPPVDGDRPSDGDSGADGDSQVADGDTPDGDAGSDGDRPPLDGDTQVDGDSQIPDGDRAADGDGPVCADRGGLCQPVRNDCSAGTLDTGERMDCPAASRCCLPDDAVCTGNDECGAASCRMSGLPGSQSCLETVPVCQAGICGRNEQPVEGSQCNYDTGRCVAGEVGCADVDGICMQIWQPCPDYHQSTLDQMDCDLGSVCCVPAGPDCAADRDCGGQTCSMSGPPGRQSCVEAQPVCREGHCEAEERTVEGAQCNYGTGSCVTGPLGCADVNGGCAPIWEGCPPFTVSTNDQMDCDMGSVCCTPSGQVCSTDAQCGAPDCRMNVVIPGSPRSCVQDRPACRGGVCVADRSESADASCNHATGECVPGELTCEQIGGVCTPLWTGCPAGGSDTLDAMNCGYTARCCLP